MGAQLKVEVNSEKGRELNSMKREWRRKWDLWFWLYFLMG